MRRIFSIILTANLLTTVVLLATAGNIASADSTSVAVAPTQLSSGDTAADLVASFYRVLLQKGPPTSEQERALFVSESSVRFQLVKAEGKLPPPTPEIQAIDGMDPSGRNAEQKEKLANYHQLVAQKVAAAGPVVLDYCRRHKEWFIPSDMRSTKAIQISAGFNFVRHLDDLKDPPPLGRYSVYVLFAEKKGGQEPVMRTVLFHIENGKIDPDAIWLDGTAGKSLIETVFPEPSDHDGQKRR